MTRGIIWNAAGTVRTDDTKWYDYGSLLLTVCTGCTRVKYLLYKLELT